MKKSRAVSATYSIPQLISKYLEYLDFVKNLSPHSLRAYASDLLQVFQIKSNGKLSGPKLDLSPKYQWITTKDFENSNTYEYWREQIKKSMSSWSKLQSRSRKRKLSSLSGFLTWLEAEEKKPFPYIIPTPKPPAQQIPNFLSVDECLSIIHYLDKTKDDPKNQQKGLLFYLLYGCGLRISEACSIKIADISLSQRHLKILGKGNKERLAVLPQKLVEILRPYTKMSQKYLFGDNPLPTRTGYELIRQLGKESGLMKSLHPHALRHSYATQLLSSGSDLRVLQQLLGHQSLSATELYTHLNIDQLAESMERHHPLSQAPLKK